MGIVIVVVVLSALALITQIGVIAFERSYPPQGQFVDVEGGLLHVVDIGPRDGTGLPVVLIHGASSSLQTMREPLGDMLAQRHRVILIDRPGHGWSTRVRGEHFTLAAQNRMIGEALGKLGVARAIFVGHSWGGALLPTMALDYPARVAGIVMLSPVLYTWPGGVGAFNWLATVPILGPLLAYTLPVPLGYFLVTPSARSVFAPQTMPDGYVQSTAVPMVLRPSVFLNNAWDLVMLKPQVAQKSRDYPGLAVPVLIVTGDADNTVSPDIHSRAFAAAVPRAKLIVLAQVGHMTQVAAPDLIVHEIETMISAVTPRTL